MGASTDATSCSQSVQLTRRLVAGHIPDLGQQSRSVPTDTTLISACSQKTIARIDLHGTPPNHSVSGRRRIAKSHTASARERVKRTIIFQAPNPDAK